MYSRGIVDLSTFSKEDNIDAPIPELIDPSTFLIDPSAGSINGNASGHGGARFLGRIVGMTKYEMESIDGFYDLDRLESSQGEDLLTKADVARRKARGSNTSSVSQGKGITNRKYHVLVWDTHFALGGKDKKYRVWLANDNELMIRHEELECKRWTYVSKAFNPIPRSFWGTSLFDIVGDKQRMKAILLNLGLETLIETLYPSMAFDKNKVQNKSSLSYKKKWIGVDGDPRAVVAPVRPVSIDANFLSMMRDEIDSNAQRATGTPEMQQGVMMTGDKTKYELEQVQRGVSSRRQLAITHLIWGEADYYRRWYEMYEQYLGKDVDAKVLAVKGVNGINYKTVFRKDLITDKFPRLFITSKKIVDAQNRTKLIDRMQLANFVLQDPESNRRYYIERLLKFAGMDSDEVTAILPKTADEIKALTENAILDKDTFTDMETGFNVEVSAEDNHQVHLRLHEKALKTNALEAHVSAHRQALFLKKSNPELFKEQTPENPKMGLQPSEQGGESVVMPTRRGQ